MIIQDFILIVYQYTYNISYFNYKCVCVHRKMWKMNINVKHLFRISVITLFSSSPLLFCVFLKYFITTLYYFHNSKQLTIFSEQT